MATRTIVTSQPDVACDVCERRLLRGEQPDIFIAAGRRRTVCELCAPRAAHEGWMRERDSDALALAPMRSRRGRNFFDRLRHARTPPAGAEAVPDAQDGTAVPEPYDFLDRYDPAPAVDSAPAEHTPGVGAPAPEPPADPADLYLERALELFNASEYPRRVSGVARSLGAPEINVRPAEHHASIINIVVAWELCWYRYAVDLSEPSSEAQVLAQGTELAELAREEQLVNGVADERGMLSLVF